MDNTDLVSLLTQNNRDEALPIAQQVTHLRVSQTLALLQRGLVVYIFFELIKSCLLEVDQVTYIQCY